MIDYNLDADFSLGILCGIYHSVKLRLSFLSDGIDIKTSDTFCIDGHNSLVFYFSSARIEGEGFRIDVVCPSVNPKDIKLSELIGTEIWKKR